MTFHFSRKPMLLSALPLCALALSAAGCAVSATGPQAAIFFAPAREAPPAEIAGAEGSQAAQSSPDPWPGQSAAATQIAQSGGLLGYWQFDEGAGATAIDLSGNGNSGTLLGGVTWSTDRAPVGSDLYATRFDGAKSYVSVPASTSLTIGGALTVAAWIKAADPMNGGTGETMGVVSQPRPDGGTGYRLGVEDGRANFGMNNGVWNCSLHARSELVPGRWTHIAGTYDGAKMTVYVDGVAQGTSTCASGSLVPSRRPVQIGREFEILGGRYFKGLIDEARVYDSALGSADLQALFAHGRG